MEDDFVSSPGHSRTPRSAGARAFFARLTDAAKAVGSVAASASELLTDKELRRKGAGYIMSEASRGIQGIQKGIESSAEAVGRTARQRLQVGSKSVQNVLKNIERQVSEFQRQQQLHDQENELDHYRKLPVDIQIGEQVYEDMPQEMRSRLWYALLERPELAHPFRPISGPKHLGSRSSSRMHSHAGASDAPLSRGSSGAAAGPSVDAANVQHVQEGEQQQHLQQEQQQEEQASQEQQQRQEQQQPASAVGVSEGVMSGSPTMDRYRASRPDVAEPSSSESHAPVGQPPAQSTSSASQQQLHEQQAASAVEQQTQGAASSSDAQPPHACNDDSASALVATQALNSSQLAESASSERAAERTVSSIPDIDDLLAQQPSGPVGAVEQPSPADAAHSDISGHAASTAARVASGQLPCVATAAEHPSGAAERPSSTTPASEDGVTGRDPSGSSASCSNASSPAGSSLLGHAADEPGFAHSAGTPQTASGADSKQAEGALPPPSATQVLEAASQDEWQAAAAARAAAAAGTSQQQGSGSSSLAGSQNTAADDSFTGVSSGLMSVSDEAAAAEVPTAASTSAGPGAVDTRQASPARAGKRVTLNTPFQDSSSSEPASSSAAAAAQQGTGSSSGAGSSHAGSSGVGSSDAAGSSSHAIGRRIASGSGAGSSGVGSSSRQLPGTRVSDGGDTEWEVVSKDALPVLSTSGEVEALETVKSIVQSLSDKDELDRLRASKAALFQAMLEVPWLPGEGIPWEYDEQCPYALLLRMDSPGGTECVDEVIQRDIHRTFPEHPLFSEAGGQAGGQQRLYRLLRAYACRDAEVGYCQGMAFAAGVLLMYLPEEPAFRLFCRLMEPFGPNLRRLYLPGLDPLKAELSRFELLLATHLPALHEHLLAAGLPAVLYASQWLMTIYAAPFPVHFAARLIDIMLLEGNDNVLPRIALSIMEAMSEELLALDDFEALITHLKVKPLQWKVHKYRQVIASAIDSHVSDSELEAAAAAVAAEGVRLGRPPSFRGAALQRRTTAGGGSFHTLAPLGEVQGLDGDTLGAGPSSEVAEASRAPAAASSAGHALQQGSATGSDRVSQPPLLGAEAELAALQAAEMAELDAAFMDMMIEADLLLPGGTFGPSRDDSETDDAGAAHSSA